MILCASDAMDANEQRINELNVFPVPDGDTGTNMGLTLGAAAAEMRKNNIHSVSQAAERTASALLRGARGNSGVILSLLFRGLAKGLKNLSTASAAEYACAMEDGVEAAYKAVMKPAEGTILTVSRLAAKAAVAQAKQSPDFVAMLSAALTAGRAALAETIDMNPVLKKAGVVDAGGQGYIVILDAMLALLEGRAVAPQSAGTRSAKTKADFSSFATEDIRFGYCTEFIIRKAGNKSADLLRAFLSNIGDCVVVVEDDEIIKTHAHTNEPGKALSEAITYGPLLTVKVENMREQHSGLGVEPQDEDELPAEDESEEEPDDGIPAPVPVEKPIGIVAVAAGEGIEQLFRDLGADGIVTGGQTMNPSTQDILLQVNRTPAETVFIFPNNKNIIMAAEQVIPLTDRHVIVVPTRTVPQGITALMSYDPEGDAATLEKAFREAIGTVHTAQVTYAARDSDFDGHPIKAGEYLALMDGALIGSFREEDSLLTVLADSFGEFAPSFINVYYGQDVAEEAAIGACSALGAAFPEAETTLINGGQPVYYYIISIE